MAGKYALSVSVPVVAIAAVLAFLIASPVHAYRACTLKGTVIDHGWRSMMVKSGGQCANINVGWRTKYVPNRRPCIGETVAVDFALEHGYMKATKVVSLTPAPPPAECYPPPPPSTAECKQVAERVEETCAPPRPVCAPKPPPHVADPLWTPGKEKPAPPTKPEVKKPKKPAERVAKAPPKEEAARPAPEEKKEPVRPEEKGLKTLKGEVVASSPKSLSIRVTEEGEAAEVINVKVGLKTKFIPFRRPAVGEKVKVDYGEENGDKFGYTVQVTQ
jgi:hypothetical protein